MRNINFERDLLAFLEKHGIINAKDFIIGLTIDCQFNHDPTINIKKLIEDSHGEKRIESDIKYCIMEESELLKLYDQFKVLKEMRIDDMEKLIAHKSTPGISDTIISMN